MNTTTNKLSDGDLIKLERDMVKWARVQRKNHPNQAGSVAREARNMTLLPCDCSKCRQPRLTEAQAEAIEAHRQATEAHQAAWAGLE